MVELLISGVVFVLLLERVFAVVSCCTSRTVIIATPEPKRSCWPTWMRLSAVFSTFEVDASTRLSRVTGIDST